MFKKNTLVALLAIMVLTAGLALAQTSIRNFKKGIQFNERGVKALKKGQVEKAEKAFVKSLSFCPSLPQSHLGLGHIALHRKSYDEALKHYRSAIDGYGMVGAMLVDVEAERYAEAQKEISRLREDLAAVESPTFKMAENERASRRAALQSQIQQLSLVEHPGGREPTEPPGEAFFFLGNAYFRMGQAAEAVKAWETCIGKSPEIPHVHNNLAVAYWKQHRYKEAYASALKAQELGFEVNPNFKADLERAMAQGGK